MTFPDQAHVDRLIEALWRYPMGHAAVLVGAGFSRYARPAHPAAPPMPDWKQIAASLCNRLYPLGNDGRRANALAEAAGTSGFLRLAQEFEEAFGRNALHRLVRELVPDGQYEPSDCHHRLLTLPWSDVFTTNWDTLLERATREIHGRNYRVVRIIAEIPGGSAPRVVKLHGSFPAHLPFIFTEEDYRTYPARFAPFLNMVQQSMLENVFCLVGFSGDDPNFLHWSGWVRDNLGDSAPTIYLVGWLDVSPHRRRMLENRNVVPIDIARHLAAPHWPEHLRHRYATEWFLYALERGRPYDITRWPNPPDVTRNPPPPKHLLPVPETELRTPRSAPRPPQDSTGNALASIRDVLAVWQRNREVYPGWLVYPDPKRYLFNKETEQWFHIFTTAVPEMPTIERLDAVRELSWRLERALAIFPVPLEKLALDTLRSIDCTARLIDGSVPPPQTDWGAIRASWREVALALLTAARFRFDGPAFSERLTMLEPFEGDHPDVSHRITHERCLRALYDGDLADLENRLREWRVAGADPAWMMRKAALLAELDRADEVVPLLNDAIADTRRNHPGPPNLANPSREGWALKLALAFGRTFPHTRPLPELRAPDAFPRWRELGVQDCDVLEDYRLLKNMVCGEGWGAENSFDRGQPFDLGTRRGYSITYSQRPAERRQAAWQAIRLVEVAGLPPVAAHIVVASDILKAAAEELRVETPHLAFRLALRLASSEADRLINMVLSRPAAARLTPTEVTDLVAVTRRTIDYAQPRVGCPPVERSVFWITRLRVAIEGLSRLVIRLPIAEVEAVLRQSMRLYRSPNLARDFLLSDAIIHLLHRSIEALPNDQLMELALDLLELPIAGVDGYEGSDGKHPEPLEGLSADLPSPERNNQTEGRWSNAVALIIRGLTAANTDSRRRAALRLVFVNNWGLLTGAERPATAEALWTPMYTQPHRLPADTGLLDWVFLTLPEPQAGIAEARFRQQHLAPQVANSEEALKQVGHAIAASQSRTTAFVLTPEDKGVLTTLIEQWSRRQVHRDRDPFHRPEELTGLSFLLPELDLPQNVADAVLAKVKAMNETNTPAFVLFAGLAKSLPDQIDKLAMEMRLGLVSDKQSFAESAFRGLRLWLKVKVARSGLEVPEPPEDLVREIGLAIAGRRKGALFEAMQTARWIFVEGPEKWRQAIADSSAQGLDYLLEELRYERTVEDTERDVPLERWACAHLALAMVNSGAGQYASVTRWAEATSTDPLPEVRHAKLPGRRRTLQ